MLCSVNIGGISENADGHPGSRNVRKSIQTNISVMYDSIAVLHYALDCARETLVTLGIVVLQANLQLYCLNEVALVLAIGGGKELLDGPTDRRD